MEEWFGGSTPSAERRGRGACVGSATRRSAGVGSDSTKAGRADTRRFSALSRLSLTTLPLLRFDMNAPRVPSASSPTLPISTASATTTTAPTPTTTTTNQALQTEAGEAGKDAPMNAIPAASPSTGTALPTSTTPTQASSNTTSAHLATLLASALSDLDALREELGAQRRRSERAERLLGTFTEVAASMRVQTGSREERLTARDSAGASASARDAAAPTGELNPDLAASSNPTNTGPTQTLPPETLALLRALDERTVYAERKRDEALARLAAVQGFWGQFDEYLAVVEQRAADARASFARVVQEGSGPLVLLDVPLPSASPHPHLSYPSSYPSSTSLYPSNPSVYPSSSVYPWYGGGQEGRRRAFGGLALPPLPGRGDRGKEGVGHGRQSEAAATTGSKRVREESIVRAGNPDKKTKRDGGEYEVRVIIFFCIPLDSMSSFSFQYIPSSSRYPTSLPSHSSSSHLPSVQRSHNYRDSRGERGERSPSTSNDVDAMLLESADGSPKHPSCSSVHHPSFQHLASQGLALKSGNKDLPVFPSPAVAGVGPSGVPTFSHFPAMNAQNQRLCRQCGVPGRYKEGKCIEKWGPGPLGAGTVCDRCRKKMKRLERRGTFEQQQSQSASGAATPASVSSASFRARSVHRTDTLPAAALNNAYNSLPLSHVAGRIIQTRVTPAVHHHAGNAPGLLPPLQTHSPIDVDSDNGEGDSLDGDAEAELDEFEEVVHNGHQHDAEGGEADGERGEGDPEADLLEAVDAAEKGSAN
ncbi:hypothetical protein DFH06DRAFT_325073 [Mycena polygramma]|nr:hypothetical protein DFH06DRAFT_325073 [Mycena polygramma]